jgi:plastocyanin
MRRLLFPLLLLLLVASCAIDEENRVQFGSDQTPSYFVAIDPADGFVPACLAIDTDRTVQWENAEPSVPANVTSVEEPPEMYSPNMQGPYTVWAHTFEAPGWFEYYDTNTGDPGRRVVDAYYGTVTYVGVSETTERGAVCVRDPGPTLGDCCCTDFDCDAPGEACVANICTPRDDAREELD